MSRFHGIRRYAIGSAVALLLSGGAALVGGGVASAHTPTIVTVATGGSTCTFLHPCAPKKAKNGNEFVPPIDLVATTSLGSITLTWVPTTEYYVLGLEEGSYTCTLLYGYNNASTFTQTTSGDTCTFTGLLPNTNYGVGVDYSDSMNVSAMASAFATTPPLPVSAKSSSTSAVTVSPSPLRAPVVLSIGPKAAAGTTTLLTVHGKQFFGKVQVWTNSSALTATVKSVKANTLTVAVKASSMAKAGTYTLTVVDPNQASASGRFTLK